MSPTEPPPPPPTERQRALRAATMGAILGLVMAALGRRSPTR